MLTFKKIAKRMDKMCVPAYLILKVSFIVSSILLASVLMIVMITDGLSPHTYEMYALAKELLSMPPLLLLVAIIGSTYIEEKTAE